MTDASIVIGVKGDLAGGKAIKNNLDEISRSANKAEGELGEVTKEANILAKVLGSVIGQSLLVAGVFATISIKAVKAFAEAEKSSLRLQAVLRATGGAAGLSAQEIIKLGDEIEGVSFFTSEQVQDAASVLATFKSVTADVFEDAIRLSTDMATVFGGDASSAATQLGKALQEPVEGISALRRVGVSFTETQKDQIKNFVETNQLVKAQKIILDELAAQVGGAASGTASGLSGAYDNLGDSLGEVQEDFGEFIADALNLQGILQSLTGFVKEFRLGLMALGVAAKDSNFLEGSIGVIDQKIRESELKIGKLGGLQGGLKDSFIRVERQKIEEFNSERARLQIELDKATGISYGPNLPPAAKPKENTNPNGGGGRSRSTSKTPQEELLEVIKRTRTEQENLNAEIANLERLRGFAKTSEEIDAVNRGIEAANLELSELGNGVDNLNSEMDRFANNSAEAFSEFITGAKSAKEALSSIVGDLLQYITRETITSPLKGLLSGALGLGDASGGGGLSSLFSSGLNAIGQSLFRPSSSFVGPVQPSLSALVGFNSGGSFPVGGNSGIDRNILSLNGAPVARVSQGERIAIRPGGESGGMGTVINQVINVSTGVVDTVRAEIVALLPSLQESTRVAVEDARLRGIT